MSAIIPIPKISISVRPGTMEDLSFIDGLQKKHTKQVGWMPTTALVGKIRLGHVLIAEEKETADNADIADKNFDLNLSVPSALSAVKPLGYCIGNDQYFKRDDVGAIFQMNVVPGHQRSFIGATLLKAQFERSAYGCKLYCCWCAQDIEANYFWESVGFVPLAFRAGSEKRGSKGRARVHIFWQKRIREGDTTTPYWFPAQTGGGSIREDRLVLPIPPGTHWRDVMPMILPKEEGDASVSKQISGSRSKGQNGNVPTLKPPTRMSRQFGPPSIKPPPPEPVEEPEPMAKEKAPRKPKRKNDPKLIAAARELRDRWLEKVNEEPALLLPQGKYDVSRALAAPTVEGITSIPALPALPALPAPGSTHSTSSEQAGSRQAIAA